MTGAKTQTSLPIVRWGSDHMDTYDSTMDAAETAAARKLDDAGTRVFYAAYYLTGSECPTCEVGELVTLEAYRPGPDGLQDAIRHIECRCGGVWY
jgi:hypothetical protein